MIAASSPWLTALPPFLVASAVCIAVVPASMWFARRTGAVAASRRRPPSARAADASARAASRCSRGSPSLSPSSARRYRIAGRSSPSRVRSPLRWPSTTSSISPGGASSPSRSGVGIVTVLLGITITSIAIPGSHLDVGLGPHVACGADHRRVARGHAGLGQSPRRCGWRCRGCHRDRCRCLPARRDQPPRHRRRRAGRGPDPQRRADGLLHRVPCVQPAPGTRLHGRLRQPLPRGRACGDHDSRRRQDRRRALHPRAAHHARTADRRHGRLRSSGVPSRAATRRRRMRATCTTASERWG